MQFERAAVLGTGMMGPGIALTLALGGVRSAIVSRSEEGAAKGLASALRLTDLLESNGLATAEQGAFAREAVTATADLEGAVRGSQLVVESVPEDLAFKQELFARMDGWAAPDTVLASNTSGLSITSIAERCGRPERVLTTHFWNPPHLIPLVEIVKGDRTAPAYVEAVRDLLARCGKRPVVVKKDTPGQLGNRLQMALIREAMNIVQEGIAEVEDVDLAARTGFGLRLPVYGILEHQDIVGLKTALSILDYVVPALNNDPRAPDIVREKVAKGETGAAVGKGFYDWSVKSADESRARRDAFVLHFLKTPFAKGD